MEDCIMKKTMKLISMTALALMGAMMTGCSEDDNIINETPTPQPAHKTVTLTTTVSMDGATTRALDADGKKTFAAGDQIAVIYQQDGGTTAKTVSEPLPAGSYTNKATFTVTLIDPKASGNIRYIYPAAMAAATVSTSKPVTDASTINYTSLSSQDGTLTNLATNLDFAKYDGTMTADAGLPDSPELDNQLAVCAFEIKNDAGTDVTSSITSLIVKEGTNTYTVTRTPAAGPIYVAMLPVKEGDIVFEATNKEKDCYIKKMSSKTLTAGLLYPLRVKLISPLAMPLTFEAKDEGGATVTCTVGSNIGSTGDTNYLEFSTDGGANWTRRTLDAGETISVTLENEGDKVMFRGDNNRLGSKTSDGDYTNFSGSGNCYVYGNVMSLLYPTTFATETSLPKTYDNKTSSHTFFKLFESNTKIFNHADKKLYLPAREQLNQSCYQEMFSGCTNLTTTPDLPATTLAKYCYKQMFDGCTNLISADVMSAEILAESCCSAMFQNCTSLASAPDLLALTLAKQCYSYMFNGCTSLVSAPKLYATTLAQLCCSYMFNGCTSLTTAPDLLAEAPATNCYTYMFYGCTSLKSIKCYLNPSSQKGYTLGWVTNVPTGNTGTFTKRSGVDWSTLTGYNGIPSDWTVIDE